MMPPAVVNGSPRCWTRRTLLAFGFGAGLSALANPVSAQVEAPEFHPLRELGWFLEPSTPDDPIVSLQVTVREWSTERLAAASVATLFALDTSTEQMIEASVVDVEVLPTTADDLLDGRWTMVVGAAAVETFWRGVYASAGRFSWGVIAQLGDASLDDPYPRDLTQILRDRFVAEWGNGAPYDLDLADLLPTDEELGGRFSQKRVLD